MTRNALVAAQVSAVIAFGFMGYACSSDDNGNGTTTGTDAGGGGGGDSSAPDAGSDGTTTGSEGGGSEGGHDATSGGQDSGGADGGHDATMGGGEGGPADAGGGGGDGGTGEAGIATCSPGAIDAGVCSGSASCAERCGVDVSMLTTTPTRRTCTCGASAGDAGDAGSRWSCPTEAGACVYPTDVDLSCMQLPTPLPACSVDLGGQLSDGGTSDGGGGTIHNGVSVCTLPNSETCGNVCGSASSTVVSYLDSADAGKSGYCVCVVGTWQCASVNDWPKF